LLVAVGGLYLVHGLFWGESADVCAGRWRGGPVCMCVAGGGCDKSVVAFWRVGGWGGGHGARGRGCGERCIGAGVGGGVFWWGVCGLVSRPMWGCGWWIRGGVC